MMFMSATTASDSWIMKGKKKRTYDDFCMFSSESSFCSFSEFVLNLIYQSANFHEKNKDIFF